MPTTRENSRDKAGRPAAEAVTSVNDAFAQVVAPEAAADGPGADQSSVRQPPRRLGVAERQACGREARITTPRSQLAAWTPAIDRADPVELLLGQEASRVQELVPIRHERMAVSPFTFYRGSALVMASDLASQPRSTLTVQLCGDAHLSNFGCFGAPDRSVVFDLNDFDETHPGPFEWDVKRLATSVVLAARDNGLADDIGLAAATGAVGSYHAAITSLAGKGELDIWYERIDQDQLKAAVEEIGSGSQRKHAMKALAKSGKAVEKAVAKARARDQWSAIAKITEVVDGRRRFLHQPPLLTRIGSDDTLARLAHGLYEQYRSTVQDDRQELLSRYEIVDLGHKVVGVGSVGLLAIALLMRGRDEDDLMVLQVKQAQASVLEAFTAPSKYAQHGQRVVAGQRLMQAASDSFLGWVEGVSGRNYYVRQLRDMKWSPDLATLDGPRLHRYAVLCGYALARAHARSGDAIAISAYLGKGSSFDRAIAAFASAYADQVQLDFEAFTHAIAD